MTRLNFREEGFPSYSSHGEDVIALALLRWLGVESGSYIEIGAYQPRIASNTALLSELGWRGILVEPNPFMANWLREERPRDKVLQAACGMLRGDGILFMLGDWASSNSMSSEFASRIAGQEGLESIQEIAIQVVTLSDVFAEFASDEPQVEVLSVDVEGCDLEVLKSGDWSMNRPALVLVEDLDFRLDGRKTPILDFMNSCGYVAVSHAVLTTVFVDSLRLDNW